MALHSRSHLEVTSTSGWLISVSLAIVKWSHFLCTKEAERLVFLLSSPYSLRLSGGGGDYYFKEDGENRKVSAMVNFKCRSHIF